MEAASEKKKRGRPNVYSSLGLDDIRNTLLQNKGERTTQNEHYIMNAISAFERLEPDGREIIYFIPDNLFHASTQEVKRAGYKRDSTILEQLGRALTQDGVPDEDFVFLAEKAASFKKQGYTSKEIARWIRQLRKDSKEAKE